MECVCECVGPSRLYAQMGMLQDIDLSNNADKWDTKVITRTFSDIPYGR